MLQVVRAGAVCLDTSLSTNIESLTSKYVAQNLRFVVVVVIEKCHGRVRIDRHGMKIGKPRKGMAYDSHVTGRAQRRLVMADKNVVAAQICRHLRKNQGLRSRSQDHEPCRRTERHHQTSTLPGGRVELV